MNQPVFYRPTYSALPTGTTDDTLIDLWIHDKPASTRRAYLGEIAQFRKFVQKPLQQVTLLDLQDFRDSFGSIKPATAARRINAVKSLFTFAHETGYLPFNVGKMVKPPKMKNTLAERILSEEEVMRMIVGETNPRNQVILRLLYSSAIRVSELCNLIWRDVRPRENAGQITVFGKGAKTRAILLPETTYKALLPLRNRAGPNDPVFRSRGGGRGKAGGTLHPSQVERIVRAAAQRVGIEGNVSPHWLRHSHATHAQERGAPIALVRETLGHETIQTTAKYSHARPGKSSAEYLNL